MGEMLTGPMFSPEGVGEVSAACVWVMKERRGRRGRRGRSWAERVALRRIVSVSYRLGSSYKIQVTHNVANGRQALEKIPTSFPSLILHDFGVFSL